MESGFIHKLLQNRVTRLSLPTGLIILCNILLTACNTNTQQPALTYIQNTYEKKNPSCNQENPCTTVQFIYPTLLYYADSSSVPKLQQHINQFLLSDPFNDDSTLSSMNAISTRFFKEFSEFQSDISEEVSPWTLKRKVRVEWLTSKILTLSYQESSYTGGAHPNTILYYKSYDTARKEVLKLNAILKEGYRTSLKKKGERIFRQDYDLPISTSLNEAGFWFKDDSFELNNNFALMRSGIKFYYNAYEIAPYSRGASEITIPYDSIKTLLRPSYKYLVKQ